MPSCNTIVFPGIGCHTVFVLARTIFNPFIKRDALSLGFAAYQLKLALSQLSIAWSS